MKYSADKFQKAGSVVLVPSSIIRSNPDQPRKSFRKQEIDALCVSVRQIGIIQPILVRYTDNNDYELISGERRLIAAKKCGLSTVPCIILNLNKSEALIYSLTENLQRKSLTFFEEADAYENLINTYSLTLNEISYKTGKSKLHVLNKLNLTYLSPEVQKSIEYNALSEQYARLLLKIKDSDLHNDILSHIINNKLNVYETENYIDMLLSPAEIIRSQPKFKKLKDIKIFINTINHAVDTMRKAGINAVSDESETSDYLEYVVRIPKMTSSPVSSCDVV